MFGRKTTGSVLCPSCGKLVGVQDDTCWNCGRRNPGLWGFAPLFQHFGRDLGFVQAVLWGCSALYLTTLLVDVRSIGMSGLSILAPGVQSLFRFGASGALPVFAYDRWWTILSAGWLHGSLLHIVLNMMWLRQLAPATAELYGASRMIIIYVVSSAFGFLLTSVAGLFFGAIPILGGAPFTVGASAAIFGLLGALVVYGRRGGSSHIGGQAWSYAVTLFVFGVIMPRVDNYAHLGGFAGGYLVARWLDPLQPERINHMIAAVLLLAATALSVLASLLHGKLF
jgi:membrane associated rhomboid family serine protease